MTSQVVLEDQQDVAGIGDGLRQRDLRRIPVTSAKEGEVLAAVERYVVMGKPDVLSFEVTSHVLAHYRFEFEDQRIGCRFLCHTVTVTLIHIFYANRRRCFANPLTDAVVPGSGDTPSSRRVIEDRLHQRQDRLSTSRFHGWRQQLTPGVAIPDCLGHKKIARRHPAPARTAQTAGTHSIRLACPAQWPAQPRRCLPTS